MSVYRLVLRIFSLFNRKARLFVDGRKHIWSTMETALAQETRPVIWFHCASLGEFEQGKPLMQFLKKNHSSYCIVLSFFSPSGYEAKKTTKDADYTFYLPLDSQVHANRWIAILNPDMAFFIKYEFWYYYLKVLKSNNIPTYLISAIFQLRHPFFKWYGVLHRRMLQCFDTIFVQDAYSARLLNDIGIYHTVLSGDTRFDSVYAKLQQKKIYPDVLLFKGAAPLLIAGSTWKDDEVLLKNVIEILPNYKLLIVPHEVDSLRIKEIEKIFEGQACLWTDKDRLPFMQVAIVNEIGHLSALYRHADVAWIGGGFNKTGIHNSVEAAVYGVSIFFAHNYNRYQEAIELIDSNAAISSIHPQQIARYLQDEEALVKMKINASTYVQSKLGATQRISSYLEAKNAFRSS